MAKSQPLFFISLFVFFSCNLSDSFENGEKIIYYPGTEIVKQTVQYKKGLKNGYLKEYFRDGSLKASQRYVNDTLTDTTVVYYENKQLKTFHVYKNKVKSGCWKDYNKNGQLVSELFFKNGLLDSVCSTYELRSGKLVSRIRYREGVKHGPEEHYYLNGKLKSKAYYYMGQAAKGTEEWYESGKPVNNDFKIVITESNRVALENILEYTIRMSPADERDEVYRIFENSGQVIKDRISVPKKNGVFVYRYDLAKGSFVMEEVMIAVFRKTRFGNTLIKTASFNAASNNF